MLKAHSLHDARYTPSSCWVSFQQATLERHPRRSEVKPARGTPGGCRRSRATAAYRTCKLDDLERPAAVQVRLRAPAFHDHQLAGRVLSQLGVRPRAHSTSPF